jgi:hypothetical protein
VSSSPPGSCLSGLFFLALLAVSGCTGKTVEQERLLVFGIDGADWDTAIPLVRQGKLPALQRLMNSGCRRTLRSLEPEALSPAIWTTVATGVLPERHGVHHFVVPSSNGSFAPVTSNDRKVAALWNILTARDISVGVIGWLATWPAEPVNGYLVASYTANAFRWGPDRPIKGTFLAGVPAQVFPPELQAELEALKAMPASVSDDELTQRFLERDVPDNPNDDAAVSIDGMRWSWATDATYERIFEHLAARAAEGAAPRVERPRVELLYFGSVDVVSHRFWKYKDPESYVLGPVAPEDIDVYGRGVENAYRSLDGVLSRVLDQEESRLSILVLSDHGFRANADPSRATSSGWHRPQGLLLAEGHEFRRGALLAEASVIDVTPTILVALGLPVAEDMDGQPALDLFTEEFRAAQAMQSVPSYEPEVSRLRAQATHVSAVDDEILDRLRALGYLE